ncbi:MAG: response regulator [Acidobacteriaceae bacterium]|nr:response regulator [Acidobacteriaceae bacterium]
MSEQNLVDAAQMAFADDFGGDFDSAGDNDFESGTGPDGQPAPGMGQSKSSRRRRRKRKSKVDGAPAGEGSSENAGDIAASAAPQTIVMEGESLALSSPAPAAAGGERQPQQRRNSNNGQGQSQPQGQGAPQGEKRWKKKFRDRERRPRNENPGNNTRSDSNNNSGGGERPRSFGGGRPDNFGNLASGGFKRKGQKQGGQKERGFVGPMDHSYRDASVDFNGVPPSTINLNGGRRHSGGRHHGDSQPIDYNMPRPIPIPEDAQTHIYFFIEELFFIAKIQESAKKLGVKISFLKNEKESIEQLTSGAEENKPALIVFDLNNANAKPLTTIPKLKTKLKRGTSIVGFLSHLQGDLKAKAMEAGCDVVMPRAAFSQNLPNLLRRYGAEEEDEINYNY